MDWAHVACIFLACDFVLTQAATDRSVVYNDYMASFDRATPSLDSEQGSIRLLSSGLLGLSVINHAVELLTVKPCSAVAHYHPAVSQLIHVISGVIHAVATACKEVKVLVVFSGHAISRTSPVSDLLAMPERTIREPATLKEGSCVSPGTDNAQQLNGFLDGAPSVVNNSLGVVQALTARTAEASMVVGGKTLQQHVTRGDVVTIPKG
ncbi:hypothetical protein N2152v2_004684 [Parachlorella kessleri]